MRTLESYIRGILKEASAEQWGIDDTGLVLKRLKSKGYKFKRRKPKDSADPMSGYIITPRNLVQEKVIHSAISIVKKFKGDIRQKGSSADLMKPYKLPGLRKKSLSVIGKALMSEGFIRVNVSIPVRNYSKEKAINPRADGRSNDVTIYDVHMYFNERTKECVMPKFKLHDEIGTRVEY